MTPRTTRFVLIGFLLLSVVVAPFLAQGDQQLQQVMTHNASVIARMSPSQRERLNHNFSDFLKLPQSERDKLQQFHQQIEQDKKQHSGELASVLNTYDNWLKTLNSHQRDQLMKTSNPKARIGMIRDLVSRQREETVRRGMPMVAMRGERRFETPPAIDEQTRQDLFQALEERAAERLTSSQREEVQALQGFRRELRLLQLLKEFGSGVNSQPLMENPPSEFASVAREIDKFTDNESLIKYVQNGPKLEPPEGTWMGADDARRLVSVIMQAVSMELFKLRMDEVQQAVDSEKLKNFLGELPMENQMELLSLDSTDFQTDLKKLFFESGASADLPRMYQLHELFLSRSFGRFRFGDGRPRSGRPPRRPDGRPPMNDGNGPPPGFPPPSAPFDGGEPTPLAPRPAEQ